MHHKLNGFITASEYAWFHQCAKSALSEFECHVGIQMPGVIRFPISRLLSQLANSIFLVWVDAWFHCMVSPMCQICLSISTTEVRLYVFSALEALLWRLSLPVPVTICIVCFGSDQPWVVPPFDLTTSVSFGSLPLDLQMPVPLDYPQLSTP